MKNNKSKIKTVFELVDRINQLRSEIKEREEELNHLTAIQFQEITPEPSGFEYKNAILEFFNKKPAESFLNIDDVADHISSQYKFAPDRNTISLRINYLVDNAKKLERVANKRGYYRLKTETIQNQEAT